MEKEKMEKKLTFGRGTKSNYFLKEGEWDSSLFSEVVYFTVDTHQIYLNGVSYGVSSEIESKLDKRYDATRIEMSDDCHVGGVLKRCQNIGDATAVIDDSITWQEIGKKRELDGSRVRFLIVDRHRNDEECEGDSGCIEFCPQEKTLKVGGVIYGQREETPSELKEKVISVNKFKKVIEEIGEILELNDTQKEKLGEVLGNL